MIKNSIVCIIGGLLLALAFINGVDAELARRDREYGRTPTGCIFSFNCWESKE